MNDIVYPSQLGRAWTGEEAESALRAIHSDGNPSVSSVYALLHAESVSGSIGDVYGVSQLNNDSPFVSSSADNNSAWLQNHLGGSISATFKKPTGVVIGDSIAEGHPSTHGRLHDNQGQVDLAKLNEAGQLSYELGLLTNVYWYNHGYGGQTTQQVRDRFGRDVLAQVDETLTPSQTLDRKPNIVMLVAGINDISLDVDELITIDNINYMIETAAENGILLIVAGIGQWSSFTAETKSKAERINASTRDHCIKHGCHYFDYYLWGSSSDGSLDSDKYVDAVHPSALGYTSLAIDLVSGTNAPMVFDSIRFDLAVIAGEVPINLARASAVTITNGSSITSATIESMPISEVDILASTDPNVTDVTVSIDDSITVTGNGVYTGFARVFGKLSRF